MKWKYTAHTMPNENYVLIYVRSQGRKAKFGACYKFLHYTIPYSIVSTSLCSQNTIKFHGVGYKNRGRPGLIKKWKKKKEKHSSAPL